MKNILIFIFFAALSSYVYSQSGIITELSGTVEIKAPGAASFTAASSGDSVDQNTVISTGFNSMALIQTGSVLLTVRPLTRLTLTEIQSAAGSETVNVNLQAGRVRVDVDPPAGTMTAMTVRSPNATASVRGTSYEFDTRNIRVHTGRVSFSGNRGKAKLVNAGSVSGVKTDGTSSNPVETGSAALSPRMPPGRDHSLYQTEQPASRILINVVYTEDS